MENDNEAQERWGQLLKSSKLDTKLVLAKSEKKIQDVQKFGQQFFNQF